MRCIVTGGTGALGQVVVRLLLERGAKVAVPYRSEDAFKSLSDGAPGNLFGAPCAVDRWEEIAGFVDRAASHMGGLDGLACIAGGYAGSGPLESAPESEWEGMFRANLETVHLACRATLPLLLRGGGSVVTVSSRLAVEGGSGAAAYAASKAAVAALTRVLALENRARGVRFNCVFPGIIDTQANRRAMGDKARWTSPLAIARTIAFLLSDDAASVTGGMVPVDLPTP
jgi:NAD(P)-dependent dehydrogenase (short-subunit alcohol dehydrogenase family)